MVKYALNFEKQDPAKFINVVKEVIETQFRNEDRAVFGVGPYDLAEEFSHLGASKNTVSQLSTKERDELTDTFMNSGVEAKKTFNNSNSTTTLSIQPAE